MQNLMSIGKGISKTFYREVKFKNVKLTLDSTAILPITAIKSSRNLPYIDSGSEQKILIPDDYFPQESTEVYSNLSRTFTADELTLQGEIIGSISIEYSEIIT